MWNQNGLISVYILCSKSASESNKNTVSFCQLGQLGKVALGSLMIFIISLHKLDAHSVVH